MTRTATRAASQPVNAPPVIRMGKRAGASPRSGSGISPSMIRASRRGTEIERKMVTTADGSSYSAAPMTRNREAMTVVTRTISISLKLLEFPARGIGGTGRSSNKGEKPAYWPL